MNFIRSVIDGMHSLFFRNFITMANKGGKMQAIDLTKLNLMQLTQFKNSLDQDLQFYQESLQNLKHAQSK